ncbi:MAG: hypothetical protein R3C14_27055 [Caldilineaceae bacterium]
MKTDTQTVVTNPSSVADATVTGQDKHPIEDDYNTHDASFRRHYQLNYADGAHDYKSFYAPAYRYGYQLSAEHNGAAWHAVEQEAQEHWASHHTSAWSDVADAVHYGWIEERDPDRLRVHHHEGFEHHRPAFEQHFVTAFPDTEETFEHFEPIYSYGYTMAVDPDYNLRTWSDVEPEVQAMWEREYHSRFMWEDYRDAVRHAWEEVRARSAQS